MRRHHHHRLHNLRSHRGKYDHNNLAAIIVIVITVVVAVVSIGRGIGDTTDFGGRRSFVFPVASALSSSSLLAESAVRTIEGGDIAVLPHFLPPSSVSRLRRDATKLHRDGNFIVDSLAGYGAGDGARDKSKFDPTKDRAVMPS
ncbi:hypothetical protein ACHAXA_003373 [Cyclostephanos tholiformis]|uniref:Uncharacterized protein n=1 Tax=Cyclostephanos tholiformis TaxID=382380 RepID=A0ABD3R6Z5_9STRA